MSYQPPTLREREEYASLGPQHEQWLLKRDSGEVEAWVAETWASGNLESYVRNRLCLAVRLFDSASDVRAYLAHHNVEACYDEMAGFWPRIAPQTFGGTDAGLAYAAWFLGRADLVPQLLDHTRAIIGTGAIDRFWTDYHRAIDCLYKGARYRRNRRPKPRGPQVLAERQMAVIEAMTSGEDSTEALAVLDAEFQRANSDRRLMLNAVTTINPSGLDPVRLDLARWAIVYANSMIRRPS